MANLKKFNFVFGSNSTGKTTIAKIIADPLTFPKCSVNWRDGRPLRALVYNRDFVEDNFNRQNQLKGIFTLGQKNIGIETAIETAKKKLIEIEEQAAQLRRTLEGADGTGGKKAELKSIEDAFQETCWEQKKKHEEDFKQAFTGYLKKESFKKRILDEAKANRSDAETLESLRKRAGVVFGEAPTPVPTIIAPTATKVLDHEPNPILQKAIIGKNDIDIAAMIARLGSGDWVSAGRKYFDVDDRTCPFCQQRTPESFGAKLAEYFDETFQLDVDTLKLLERNYAADSSALEGQLQLASGHRSRFFDHELFAARLEQLRSTAEGNRSRLKAKLREPSLKTALLPLGELVQALVGQIDAANAETREHNRVVENLAEERKRLAARVWNYLAGIELKRFVLEYTGKRSAAEKAIANLETQLEELRSDWQKTSGEIKRLERSITSIQPTVDGINKLLKQVGFTSFLLATTADGKAYRLVRPDNADARPTLSEGEKSFVTFLYFYYLLQGSDSDTGQTNDRIAVFDDPVSSLDGDVLFIVSTLIRDLFRDRYAGPVKQVFVLTHNVYFLKEVTFWTNAIRFGAQSTTYWIVRKTGLESRLVRCEECPVSTSYELLWRVVRDPSIAPQSIQNTLRRILEHYFKHLGGLDLEEIADAFDGEEKIMCRSLLLWANDGSHSIGDDLNVQIENEDVEKYLSMFKQIFQASNQIGHYLMMMREDAAPKSVGTATTGPFVRASSTKARRSGS
jgi:wobble nucleotide-excising tRNase